MKMTKEDNVKTETVESNSIIDMWIQAGQKLSLQTGVYAGVYVLSKGGYLARIYFKVGEHEFDSLSDLRKAIKTRHSYKGTKH